MKTKIIRLTLSVTLLTLLMGKTGGTLDTNLQKAHTKQVGPLHKVQQVQQKDHPKAFFTKSPLPCPPRWGNQDSEYRAQIRVQGNLNKKVFYDIGWKRYTVFEAISLEEIVGDRRRARELERLSSAATIKLPQLDDVEEIKGTFTIEKTASMSCPSRATFQHQMNRLPLPSKGEFVFPVESQALLLAEQSETSCHYHWELAGEALSTMLERIPEDLNGWKRALLKAWLCTSNPREENFWDQRFKLLLESHRDGVSPWSENYLAAPEQMGAVFVGTQPARWDGWDETTDTRSIEEKLY